MSDMVLTKEGIIELLFQKPEDNNSPFAKTKIILRIYEYNGKCSLYLLFYFLNAQRLYTLEKFTRRKNKELKIFKNMVENYNVNNALLQ